MLCHPTASHNPFCTLRRCQPDTCHSDLLSRFHAPPQHSRCTTSRHLQAQTRWRTSDTPGIQTQPFCQVHSTSTLTAAYATLIMLQWPSPCACTVLAAIILRLGIAFAAVVHLRRAIRHSSAVGARPAIACKRWQRQRTPAPPLATRKLRTVADSTLVLFDTARAAPPVSTCGWSSVRRWRWAMRARPCSV